MAILRLTAHITESGELKVALPEGLPPGPVEITLEFRAEDLPWEQRPWTEEEIRELMTFSPASGAEIVAMLAETDGWWENPDITDGAAWVEELRRKQAEGRDLKW